MQDPNAALDEHLLSEAVTRNIRCSGKAIIFVSLPIGLIFSFLFSPAPDLFVQVPSTSMASPGKLLGKPQYVSQQPRAWYPLKPPSARQFVQTMASSASTDAQDLDQHTYFQPATPQSLGRRHAALALIFGGVAMGVAQPSPALSAAEFLAGPKGLKYYDFAIGDGDAVSKNDLLTVDYSLVLVNENFEIDKGRDFVFSADSKKPAKILKSTEKIFPGWYLGVLGEGDMAPMRKGGQRQVLVPFELGYGNERAACLDAGFVAGGFNQFGAKGSTCIIPPRQRLILQIKIKDINSAGAEAQ